jgi:asparagine synthase (glutamine-hydrolysing)
MCGITAIISQKKDKEEILNKSLFKILHRGSSNFEYRIFNNFALGTNRLPIVDRVFGQQPAFNEDDSIYAILNGEIFNHKELKVNLINLGHKFKTNSDTEVLVHLYEEFGEKMLEHIDSEMFSFIIINIKTNDFFVARDRFGVKPLYYAKINNDYYFVSELKQLTQFDFINEVNEFPKAHFMKNGEIIKYYEIKIGNEISNEEEAVKKLTKYIVDAVKKRVDTDLPIAVLLSGGVDSSLLMEVANRFHKDVTGYILGKPGSSDYENAIKLCEQYKYKYKVIYPDVDYADSVEELIYYLELYEAQVIRQSFALDILSKAVARDGYIIALAGDASDEIFGGYNEFIRLSETDINKGCGLITESLSRSHNVRLDRMSMRHTLEIRAPFFDTQIVDYAMKISGSLKIYKKEHDVTTKYILRRVASQFLPEYIVNRYKVPFSNGAGMNVGFNFRTQDGDVAKEILNSKLNKLEISDFDKINLGLITREEEIYYSIYKNNGYAKLVNYDSRIVTKETLSQLDTGDGISRIVVAEFDKMPIYFPVYLAQKLELFSKRNLDVNFISTGGDDLTYNSLFSGSAQIGISDPVFSFSNMFNTKGKIFGSLINHVPVVAVTIEPTIIIDSKNDFKKYKLGSFQKYSTTNTLLEYILPNTEIKTFNHKEIVDALKQRQIDIAFVTLDYGYFIESLGGKIIYRFDQEFGEYLFTGLFISDNIDSIFISVVDKFKSAIKEAIVFIGNFREETLDKFEEIFPLMPNADKFISDMKKFWHKKLDEINENEMDKSKHVWSKVYPQLMKATTASFIKQTEVDKIIKKLTKQQISREVPYLEDKMVKLIEESILEKKPLNIITFWGASNKEELTESDFELLEKVNFISKLLEEENLALNITFILTDVHAKSNGFKKEKYISYLQKIEKEILNRGFNALYLSSIWNEYKLDEKEIVKFVKKLNDEKWLSIRISNLLEKSAKNIGHLNSRESAKKYYSTRILENKHIENKFPNSIFIIFSDDKLQEIYPNLPTLYIWPFNRGKVDKLPWFE